MPRAIVVAAWGSAAHESPPLREPALRERRRCGLAASLGGAPSDVFTYALITDAETQP